MAQRFPEISDKLARFIAAQKIYFVGTATSGGRVNISPKGMDSLRVIDKNRVVWLNVTGSGNETAAHVQENPRMTLMFCAFEGDPLILRLYGKAKVIHQRDAEWQPLFSQLHPLPEKPAKGRSKAGANSAAGKVGGKSSKYKLRRGRNP